MFDPIKCYFCDQYDNMFCNHKNKSILKIKGCIYKGS